MIARHHSRVHAGKPRQGGKSRMAGMLHGAFFELFTRALAGLRFQAFFPQPLCSVVDESNMV